MKIEDYFDFLAEDDIRLRGTRVGIETVLMAYLERKQTPEQIVANLPNLRLDQVYATILFYLTDRERVDSYLNDSVQESRREREEQDSSPPESVLAFRARRDARNASLAAGRQSPVTNRQRSGAA